MTVSVRIPTMMQKMFGGAKDVQADAATLGDLIVSLDQRYPGFKGKVETEDGELHRFVNVYVNDEDVRFTGGLDTCLKDGDVVSVLPALAGGRC